MIIETVHAVNNGALFSDKLELGEFVLLAISLVVLVSSILSIAFILWGGLLLILSGGKDDKIQPAINTIRYAIIGIVLTVLTIFLFPILGRLLGLDVEKYAQPSQIFQKIEEIGDKIFGNDTGYTISSDTIDPTLQEFPADFSDL
ncbi:hypothetical protein MK079_05245 [Candidatus Gracilibacteria bacterium]|nr:hypothetical protein [Candidatus Gracilibacteria bacterium]